MPCKPTGHSSGSSPRVRERHGDDPADNADPGSSPRVRGTERDVWFTGRRPGSSPRVRGTGHRPLAGSDDGRFIPARAGNGSDCVCMVTGEPVHPRACGERRRACCRMRRPRGSSPRVRGTDSRGRDARQGRRFIPARAGNGRARMPRAGAAPVHPRACGERPRSRRSRAANTGSSPRVRGTARALGAGGDRGRFIPARAGNGATTFVTNYTTTVHPRACGERAASSGNVV